MTANSPKRVGRAFAAMEGEPAVSEAEIQKAAIPLLGRRVACNFQAQAEGLSSDDIVRRILAAVPPREDPRYAKKR